PDDAGFGFDYRIIKSSIEKLNRANKANLKAKAYWDFAANNWTLGEFVPKHFPDLLTLWKSRDPKDEFVIGPYNNGANSAATKKEFLKSIEWTQRNPLGLGLNQMFKNVGAFYRPQEMFFGSGQVNWLHEAGMKGLILQYATYSFNAFSNFVPAMTWEDRFNPIWFKSHPADKPIVLLPAISPVDLVNFISLEKLMTDLRKKQLNGEITRNVVIHMNMDADAVSWEPLVKNTALNKTVPNTTGLQEFIDVVNKYSWADFTTPTEYLKIEQPKKTITVTQDLADGAFDGMASWAEKEIAQSYWPKIENSRMMERFLGFKDSNYEKRDSWNDAGFKNRVLALSTTHFGMSTPVVNYQRYLRLQRYAGDSYEERLGEMLNWANRKYFGQPRSAAIHIEPYPRYGQTTPVAMGLERTVSIVDKNDLGVPTNSEFIRRPLDNYSDVIETYTSSLSTSSSIVMADSDAYAVSNPCVETESQELIGQDLRVEFSSESGIRSLTYKGELFGDSNFLSPFIGFKENIRVDEGQKRNKKTSTLIPSAYGINAVTCRTAPQISQVNLKTQISFKGIKNHYSMPIDYRFWTHQKYPYLFVDIKAEIPYTLEEGVPDTADRRFLRHVDWRWQEIAISQLKPSLKNNGLLKVWKMNYEGLVSSYEINYEKFNPKNSNFDTLNNHLTPGWVAVSNGEKGLIVAFNTTKRSSFGAIPLRVRNQNGSKNVALNPFGTYFGKQMDYSHVGGEKLGTILANMGAAYIKPNAPSYAGIQVEYDLMLMPYIGDEPPKELIQAALNYAYPSMTFKSGADGKLQTGYSIQNEIRNREMATKYSAMTMKSGSAAVVAPRNLSVAKSDGGFILTWEIPEGAKAEQYEVLWRADKETEWKSSVINNSKKRYFEVSGLTNGIPYTVAMRSVQKNKVSGLSNIQTVIPSGNFKDSLSEGISPSIKMLLMFTEILVKHHSIRDPDAGLLPEYKKVNNEINAEISDEKSNP
ncbi:MAG: fibronectin type III domain-containing protein, partial [Bdellovibrionota bacterium]